VYGYYLAGGKGDMAKNAAALEKHDHTPKRFSMGFFTLHRIDTNIVYLS
jgi:hypothetical protein